MTLVDASAWAAFLRGDGSPADRALTRRLEQRERLFTTDLIAARLLADAPDEEAAARVQKLVASLDRCAPPGPLDVERAAHLYRRCRDQGSPLRSLSSALLAVVALRDGHELLADHPDFAVLEQVAGLRLHGGGEKPSTGGAHPRPHPRRAPAPDLRPAETPPPTPLSDEVRAGPAQPIQPSAAYILVLEDEPSAARILEDTLTGPGRVVVVTGSAREARARLAERVPDAIVMDLVLPDEDGRMLLPDLRRDPRTKDAGVVVVTGKAGPRTREECFALGADAFFDKPFDAPSLVAAVMTVLQEGRSTVPDPDPLLAPLTLSEVQKLLTTQRTDPGSARKWTVGLVDIDTDRPGAEANQAAVTGGDTPSPRSTASGDDPPLLPSLLRTAITELQRRTLPGEWIARWGVDQLVLVSPARSPSALAPMLEELTRTPGLRGFISTAVRPVEESEDLLDAVSKAASAAVEVAPMRPGDPATPAPGTTPAGQPRVVLVEDDPVTAALVRHRLVRSGFDVEHHTDGAAGLAGISARPPHVVILDVQLPSMDGFEILGRLRESDATRAVPVLMFTSLGRQEHVQRGFELGADDFVTKPFSPGELLTRVFRLVRRR